MEYALLTKSEKLSYRSKLAWSKRTKEEKSEWGRKLQEQWVKKTTKKQRKQWSKIGRKVIELQNKMNKYEKEN